MLDVNHEEKKILVDMVDDSCLQNDTLSFTSLVPPPSRGGKRASNWKEVHEDKGREMRSQGNEVLKIPVKKEFDNSAPSDVKHYGFQEKM